MLFDFLFNRQDSRREIRAAEERWRAFNERKRQEGCPCGNPGTVPLPSHHGQVGSVVPVFWRCDEHKNVSLTTPWTKHAGGNFVPDLPGGTREDCSWRTGWNVTRLVTECQCGTHVGEPW